MLKFLVGFSLFILTFYSAMAQSRTFAKVPIPGQPLSRFDAPKIGGFGFGDFNGDGYDDAVISGQGVGYGPEYETSIYLNDGSGSLSEGPYQCLPDAWGRPHFAWDVDNDGDVDLLVCNLKNDVSAELYLNDGTGLFDLDTAVVFPVLFGATVFVEDVNSDGEKDILISGAQNSNGGNLVFHLYTGSANGSFVSQNNSFAPVYRGAMDVGDFDADGDNDLVVVGESNGLPLLKFYSNQGNLNFTEITHFMWPAKSPSNYTPLERADVKFGNINGDSYLDLAVIGIDHNGDSRTSVYTNNLGSSFTEVSIPQLADLESGEIYLTEVTGDTLNDIVIRGQIDFWNKEAAVIKQTASGWVLLPNVGIDVLESGTSAMHDIDNDGDMDFFSAGGYRTPHVNTNTKQITRQYMNEQDGTFSLALGTQFNSKFASYKAFADFNSDGYQDFILSRQVLPSSNSVSIYLNNQNNTFTETPTSISQPVTYVCVADFNGDGFQDLVAPSRTGNNRLSVFFGTSNLGVYSSPVDYALYDYEGGLHLADINQDGHMDICFFDKIGSNNPFELKFLINNGSGVFASATTVDAPIIDRLNAAVKYADFDGDGELDVFVTSRLPYTGEAHLYLQNSFSFAEDTAFTFPSVPASAARTAVGDFDGNGLLDALIIGDLNGGTGGGVSHLLFQDSIGYYSAHTSSGLPVLEWGTLDTADVDLDGDLDLLYLGYHDPDRTYRHDVYINDGTGTFSPGKFVDIHMVQNSWFMDTDNDGDQDIVQAGYAPEISEEIGAVIENKSCSVQNSTTQLSVCDPYEWPITGCTYSSSGVYSYSHFDGSGCYVTQSLDLNFEGASADVRIQPDTGLFSIGQYESYQWFSCDSILMPLLGDTAQSFIPSKSGQYALVVSNGSCSDTSECIQFNFLNVDEFRRNQISIAPNPTSGLVYIQNLQSTCSYRLYDSRGVLLQKGFVSRDSDSIRISSQHSGIYVLYLSDAERGLTEVHRVILTR